MDDKLVTMLSKVRRESFDLSTHNIIMAISSFWAKYFGLQATTGVGKIIVYLLYQMPSLHNFHEPFFQYPGKDKDRIPLDKDTTKKGVFVTHNMIRESH